MSHRRIHFGAFAVLFCMLLGTVTAPAAAAGDEFDQLLARTGKQVSAFLEQFSDVKCTEQVTQEKFAVNGKVEGRERSTYDYLVILTNAGGELTLNESRLPTGEARREKNKNSSLLVSNGFATLFLVFHPYYAPSFRFTALADDVVDGRRLAKIHFEHIAGMRSPAALALRGREYPLELSGDAWINPQSGVITRISAGIDSGMEDVGLRFLHSEIIFTPVSFRDEDQAWWFPSIATVEVASVRQHWKNLHQFTDYKRFSVSTEERVSSQ